MIPDGMDLSGIDLTTEVVSTERLVLRPFRPDDEDAVLTACQDPDIQQWITTPGAPGGPRAQHRLAGHRRAGGLPAGGVVRGCLDDRAGGRADAVLFGRLPGD